MVGTLNFNKLIIAKKTKTEGLMVNRLTQVTNGEILDSDNWVSSPCFCHLNNLNNPRTKTRFNIQ